MLSYTTVQSLGQVRLEEMHEQARRAALAKTARRARRTQRHQAAHRTQAVLAGRPHPPGPTPGAFSGVLVTRAPGIFTRFPHVLHLAIT